MPSRPASAVWPIGCAQSTRDQDFAARCALMVSPMIALGPLFIVRMGMGIGLKIAAVVLMVIFPVAINTKAGLRTTSQRVKEILLCFDATPRQIFLKLLISESTERLNTQGLFIGVLIVAAVRTSNAESVIHEHT
jgi:NitT/TauT family transport system permease protein